MFVNLFTLFKKHSLKSVIILSLLIIILLIKSNNLFFPILIQYIRYYILNDNINNSPNLKSNLNNFFFFEENQDKLNYCTEYGLFVYDYYYDKNIKYGNIGDYIQSLAALQYLPKNCKPYFIDRDRILFYKGPKVKLIMNGWFLLRPGSLGISQQIEPIFVSYHLFNDGPLPTAYLIGIKNFTPIGCRDMHTKDNLIKNGVNAYFSSCLTTTLDIDYSSKDKKRSNDIIFIDYKFGDYPKADEFLKSLKAYNFNNITHINHQFNLNLSHIDRFKLAKRLLDKYSRAKLVVTTRIHGALPCLSFKTPVILINKEYDYKRFDGIYNLLNTIGINSQNKFEIRVNISNKGLVYNSDIYVEYSKQLKNKLDII